MRFYTSTELRQRLDFGALMDFMAHRHQEDRGESSDILIGGNDNRFLVRAATSATVYGTKLVTIVADNASRGLPSVQALFVMFDRKTGVPRGLLDATELTYWKTAADSGLGSRYLSRLDARVLLICGAGGLAPWLVRGHLAARPSIDRVIVWNRTLASAQRLAASLTAEGIKAEARDDLPSAVAAADIISTATMAREPFLKGAWLKPGQHIDLVGSFGPDTREADDDCMRRASVFVDSRETALHGVGDVLGPIASGALSASGIRGDLYDLATGGTTRSSVDEITLYKNAGGAHLDLMTAEFLTRF